MLRAHKKSCSFLTTLFLLSAFQKESPAQGGAQVLTVSVYNDAHVAQRMLVRAEQDAEAIFHRAGMVVMWLNCPLTSDTSGSGDCGHPAVLTVRITAHSIPAMDDAAFGVAFLGADGYGRSCDVFYDRAEQLQSNWHVNLADILGNVMAHELGHLLLGSNAHAGTGIMRAHWQSEDLRSLAMGSLQFTPDEVKRMQVKLLLAKPSSPMPLSARPGY